MSIHDVSKAVKGADSGGACNELGWYFVGMFPKGPLTLQTILYILHDGRFLTLTQGHPLIEWEPGYITRYLIEPLILLGMRKK
jgi:hypothetical protein